MVDSFDFVSIRGEFVSGFQKFACLLTSLSIVFSVSDSKNPYRNKIEKKIIIKAKWYV